MYPSETGSSEGYTSDLAVDGYRTASLWHESCMTTNPESPIPPMWSVFYRQPYYLFMINILNRDGRQTVNQVKELDYFLLHGNSLLVIN